MPIHPRPYKKTSKPFIYDSGASHHITNDLNNLSLHASYDVTEKLITCNDSYHSIAHIGSLNITISMSLPLTNVFCVASIARNIISLSCLCHDNPILIQLFFIIFSYKGHQHSQDSHYGYNNFETYEWQP